MILYNIITINPLSLAHAEILRNSASSLSALLMSYNLSVAHRPTESELDLELAELVNWQRFATHLPDLTRGDIEKIEQDNRDVQRQKLELYGTWLRKCPNASWNDIVLALEKSKEITLTNFIKMKLNVVISSDAFISREKQAHDQIQPFFNQEVYLLSEEKIVEELQKLHRSFTSLARDIHCKLDELVKSGKLTLCHITIYVQEAQVGGMKGLTEVNTIDDLFSAIHPHNDYLDCELLEMIVEEYLDDDDITKVKAHIDKVKNFKHTAITIFEERENKNFAFESAFLESSQCGDDEAVQFLLGLEVNVDYSNCEGQTALILAILLFQVQQPFTVKYNRPPVRKCIYCQKRLL